MLAPNDEASYGLEASLQGLKAAGGLGGGGGAGPRICKQDANNDGLGRAGVVYGLSMS